jgi:hypothetical protein
MWWFNWRYLTHLKDEALSPMGYMMEQLPLAPVKENAIDTVNQDVNTLMNLITQVSAYGQQMIDWVRVEFGFDKPGALAAPHTLEVDDFIAAVRKALPKSRKLSTAEMARVRQEYTTTIGPARGAATEALALERRLSELVNAAYGLTPDEVKLMWDTAPPRMPFGRMAGDT